MIVICDNVQAKRNYTEQEILKVRKAHPEWFWLGTFGNAVYVETK